MKVLMLNGSPHPKGATFVALSRIAAILAAVLTVCLMRTLPKHPQNPAIQ